MVDIWRGQSRDRDQDTAMKGDKTMTIGENIYIHRRKNMMSQEKLGEQIGKASNTISRWEIGQNIPDAISMIKMANLFGVPISDLYAGVEAD